MGEVIYLHSYRAAVVSPPNLALACRGMAAGLARARGAARLLSEAVADLRDLARWDAEQALVEAGQKD